MRTLRWGVWTALTGLLELAPALHAQDAPHHRQARELFERLISFRSAAGHKQVPPMVQCMTDTSSGIFMKDSDVFAHRLNERIPVASFYQGVDHIHDLAVTLGGVAGR